jgi:hypothetical protein
VVAGWPGSRWANVVEGVVAVTAGARERRALKLVAATFFLLAVYVVVEGSVA